MERFFFDTADGGGLIRDEVGLLLPHRETARKRAIEALPDMAQDELPDGDRRNFLVVVRDADRRPIYTAELVLTGRWLD